MIRESNLLIRVRRRIIFTRSRGIIEYFEDLGGLLLGMWLDAILIMVVLIDCSMSLVLDVSSSESQSVAHMSLLTLSQSMDGLTKLS